MVLPPVALVPVVVVLVVVVLVVVTVRHALLVVRSARRTRARSPIAHQRVFRAVSDPVLVVDDRGVIVDANPAAERLLARLRVPARSRLTGTRIGPPLSGVVGRGGTECEEVLTGVWGSSVDLHVRACRLYDRRTRPVGWTLVARDVTGFNRQRDELLAANATLRDQLREIDALRADLAEQAIRDPLTDLYNRRHLMSGLAAITTCPRAATTPLSLAVIDLDHFKRVNDRHGHPVGDLVLVQVAGRLRRGVRPPDLLARHGGEEFVLVMRETGLARARQIVESLRAGVGDTPIDVGGTRLWVTLSAGLACHPAGAGHLSLLRQADEALYQAKRQGRDRVVCARPESGRASTSMAAPGTGD